MGNYYTEACDLYSFGIVLFEIFSGKGDVLFTEFLTTMRVAEIFPLLRDGTLRPTLPGTLAPWMRGMIERLWSSASHVRPSARQCFTSLTQRSLLPALSLALTAVRIEGKRKEMYKWFQLDDSHPFRDLVSHSFCIGNKAVAVTDVNGRVSLIDLESYNRCTIDQLNDGCAVCAVSS